MRDTKNYYQKSTRPCRNCSNYYEYDPVYYQPWHQRFDTPQVPAPSYIPKTFH